jgi:amino acid adenylation domain-containing protein
LRVVPDHVRPANARARTSVVDEVASICRDVLGSDHIGLRDDLFDLGVDATAAMRILAHLEAKLAVQIPLPMLFELEPTIERLAIEIEHRRAVAVGESPAEVAKATSPEQLASLREGVRHRLLFQWNGTSVDYGKDRTLTSLFEEQVARTPDAIAVQFEDRRLSYRELSVASNRVAAHLHRAGAHPGALVGIYLERSSDLVVAILGVLKAGCAYVPIDPELPSARAARIVADALPQVVLTRRQLRHRLPKGPPNVLDVEQCTRDSSATSAAPLPAIAPDAPACVLYSPGWFDCPIGVVVAHRSIVNVIEWITSTLETSPRDVFLQSASASVAASLYELYAAWTVGAKLVVLPPDAHRDSRWLLEIAKREGVTILQTSGAMLQGLLDEPSFARLESLRCVCSHGDALGEALVERLLGSHPARLFSVDEPSETCGATYHEYVRRASSGDARGHARVGRAFPNTQLYVLDEHLEPLPLGLAGELFVGGAGEPLDYHAQPSLSAGRFVRDPFAPEDGRRLFRTGERATRRGDGTIERVAQLDDAVDVGGYRVKLSDLDAILLQDHRVREAAVVARARTSGGTQLTGYVACEGPSSPCASDLQRVLMNVLPEVLSEIVFLEALPRTTDGRIDRTALIVTSARETASVVAYVAPRDSIEERLANVFSQMLRIEKVGVNDDFFALGGHSLVAMQLVNRIFTLMGTELPIRALFEAPTVAGLAARIKAGPSAADAPPLVRTEIEGGTVLSFWQESTLTWERKRPPTATWTGGLRIRFEGVLDVASLTRATCSTATPRSLLTSARRERFQSRWSRCTAPLTRRSRRSLVSGRAECSRSTARHSCASFSFAVPTTSTRSTARGITSCTTGRARRSSRWRSSRRIARWSRSALRGPRRCSATPTSPRGSAPGSATAEAPRWRRPARGSLGCAR